jgi:hypothetical protein
MMPGFQGLLEVVRKDIRFPIRIRRASRRGRGGVFDLPMEVGRFHALHATFLGNFIDIVFQQAKAVADNCSDAAAPPPNTPLRSLRESLPIRSRKPFVATQWPFRTGSCQRMTEKVNGEARSESGALSVSVSNGIRT